MPRTPPLDANASKRPYLSDDDEWPDWSVPPVERERGEENEFARTQNYGFVALAIGDWASSPSFPEHPPQWAIDACLALKERVAISTSPVIEAREGPKVSSADDKRLEMLAEIMLNKGIREKLGIQHSLRSAIRYVLNLSGPEDTADYYRLARLWRLEKDHRLKRAGIRTFQRFKKQGLFKV